MKSLQEGGSVEVGLLSWQCSEASSCRLKRSCGKLSSHANDAPATVTASSMNMNIPYTIPAMRTETGTVTSLIDNM